MRNTTVDCKTSSPRQIFDSQLTPLNPNRYLYVFPYDISKTEAAGIRKLDIEMFHDESWKPFISGSKGQRSKTVLTWVIVLL